VQYPATELQCYNDHTKGWQSPRFSEYPQEIIIQFHHHIRMEQIQVLSHESMIPNKIEVFTSDKRNEDPEELDWTRLGYFTLGDNEDTKWQARELKTVDLISQARYLKLKIGGCHINRENMFSQVGLVALTVFGKKISGGGGKHHIGESSKTKLVEKKVDAHIPPDLDDKMKQVILDIIALKENAVSKEDFSGAKGLRDAEIVLKKDAQKLVSVRREKHACVESENYERAHHCKEEAKSIENAMLTVARSKREYRMLEKMKLARKAAKAAKFGAMASAGRWDFFAAKEGVADTSEGKHESSHADTANGDEKRMEQTQPVMNLEKMLRLGVLMKPGNPNQTASPTNLDVLELYQYRVEFPDGPLGLGLAPPPNRDKGNVVTVVTPGSAAAKCNQIKVGDTLVGIGPESTINRSHEETVALIKETERPTIFSFARLVALGDAVRSLDQKQEKKLKKLWEAMDPDNAGYVTKQMFQKGFSSSGINMTEEQVDNFLNFIDKDNSGDVSYEEFREYVLSHAQIKRRKSSSKKKRQELNPLPTIESIAPKTSKPVSADIKPLEEPKPPSSKGRKSRPGSRPTSNIKSRPKSRALPTTIRRQSSMDSNISEENEEDKKKRLLSPEPLPASVVEACEPMIALFGMRCVRCFYSKVWQLRDSAITKMRKDLPELVKSKSGDSLTNDVFLPCSFILKIGGSERVAKVFRQELQFALELFAAVDDTLPSGLQAQYPKTLKPNLDAFLVQLSARMGDNNKKICTEAIESISSLTGSRGYGNAVQKIAMSVPSDLKPSASGIVLGKLDYCLRVMDMYGLQKHNIQEEQIFEVMRALNSAHHQNKSVRSKTGDVIMKLGQLQGRSEVMDRYMNGINDAQRQIYNEQLLTAKLNPTSVYCEPQKFERPGNKRIPRKLSDEGPDSNLKKLWEKLDADKSGHLSPEELQVGLNQHGFKLTEEQVKKVLQAVDEDRSGHISFDEFYSLITKLAKSKSVKAASRQQSERGIPKQTLSAKNIRPSKPFSVVYPDGAKLGVAIRAIQGARMKGIEVAKVFPNGISDRGGVKIGDRLVAVGDKPCEGMEETAVKNLIASSTRPLHLSYAPADVAEPLIAECKKIPAAEIVESKETQVGSTKLTKLFVVTYAAGEQIGLALDSSTNKDSWDGLVVTTVDAAGVSEKGGVAVGDLLIAVGDTACSKMSKRDVLSLMKSSSRPMLLSFSHPDDVDAATQAVENSSSKEKKVPSIKEKGPPATTETKPTETTPAQTSRSKPALKEERLRQMWENMDTDGSGHLSPEELRKGLYNIGFKLNDKQVDKLIKALGKSNAGHLSFDEFSELVRKITSRKAAAVSKKKTLLPE
jgi:Ca2+-binding EF-hand superfamily protein